MVHFSLYTLLIVVAVVAGLAFVWAKSIEPYPLQREAIAAITRLGGTYKAEDAVARAALAAATAQVVYVT